MERKLLPGWALLIMTSFVNADYRDDISYTQLQLELGSNIPDGSGVAVTQVEAPIGETDTNVGAWVPDINTDQFTGKNIVDKSVPSSNGVSDHATGVGKVFYGNSSAMAFAIVDIDSYSADNWLEDGFLNTDTTLRPQVSSTRIANHSWVGEFDTTVRDLEGLKRVDWLVEEDEFIQVVGMNNGTTHRPLLGSSFNSIAVGRTDGNHSQGSGDFALDLIYKSGRARPDIVVPMNSTSGATPVVASAAALLIEQAHSAAQGPLTTISNTDQIYNGERSEVIKAVMMAGADRITQNTATNAQITDYRTDPDNQATNGLDKRFGAGQLNVRNNYMIVAAGEQDSLQDGGAATVEMLGYDYDSGFGGDSETNTSASYAFETTVTDGLQLTASLVWNIDIEEGIDTDFSPDATLHNLDLFLFDVTGGSESLLASSASQIDNTENLWFFLEQDRDYELRVLAADDSSFDWDYGLAWHLTAVPVPAAVWFFITGLLGLLSVKRANQRL